MKPKTKEAARQPFTPKVDESLRFAINEIALRFEEYPSLPNALVQLVLEYGVYALAYHLRGATALAMLFRLDVLLGVDRRGFVRTQKLEAREAHHNEPKRNA